MAVSWLKWKFRKPKVNGRYNAREGTQAGKRKRNKKEGRGERPPQQRVMIVGPFGRRRFEWRDW